MREETTHLTYGILKPKLSNMDTVALAVNQLPLGQDQQNLKIIGKEIQIIVRLFLVIAMHCQANSSQIISINQPPALLKVS